MKRTCLNINNIIHLALIVFAPFLFQNLTAQELQKEVAGLPVNYDEEKVGNYILPDPLVLQNGEKVTTPEMWFKQRRPEILRLYETEQFGKSPGRENTSFFVFDKGTPAFGNKAIRKQITLYFTEDTSSYKTDLVLYLPAKANKAVPVFLMISFFPNSLTINDPGLKPGMMWNREKERVSAAGGRGFGFFDVEKFLAEGIAVANIYYGDIEPDFPEGIKYGIRGHFLKKGETWPAPDEWGAISAWSWGLSCAMDYLETDPQVNAKQVTPYGVSRLGKTVLWAGAQDERFGMVISSCSGEGGAALSMRDFGETIGHMVAPSRYFYQFCGNRAKYAADPKTSPIDAHMLISLMAPRPLLLQTGDTDYWSDSKGEFLATVAAGPVYDLLGKKGLETDIMPATNQPILNDLGYNMHSGGHGTLPGDYDVFIAFMKKHFFKDR